MSLILNGIDLPEEEETISLMIEPDGTVYFYVWDSTENDKLTSDGRTNAIQIPKGHGNLKDDKEILARAEQEVDGLVMSAEHLPMVIEWILDKSDTFLEAEE